MITLIKNGTLVTVDKDFNIILDGAVVIEYDRIINIGKSADMIAQYPKPDRVIDAQHHCILPGFVSSHNHLGYTLFRGRAEDVGAKPTPSLFLPMKQLIKPQDRKSLAALGAVELLKGGVTTVLEMEEDADSVAPFLSQLGIRAGLAIMTNDVDVTKLLQGDTVFDADIRKQQLKQTEHLIEKWNGAADGRLTAFVAANMALSCSSELLTALRALADKYSVGVTYHVGLGSYEVDLIQQRYQCSPFKLAKNIGFLSADAILAHCHYMNDNDMDLLQASKASVAHCPVLNSLRAAAANIEVMLERGIPVALGLDNYFADYFDVMRACIAVARVKSKNPTFLTAKDVLKFATIGAAKAMKLDNEIGSLEIGKKADIQLVNMKQFGICPVTDPVSTLVYHAHAHNVDTVIVDGKIVVSDNTVLTVNAHEILDQAQLTSDALWQQFDTLYATRKGASQCTITTA